MNKAQDVNRREFSQEEPFHDAIVSQIKDTWYSVHGLDDSIY